MANKDIFEKYFENDRRFLFKKKIFLKESNLDLKFINFYIKSLYNLQIKNEDILFLDIETNGLYGTGCFPFLYGLGFFIDNNFCIYQVVIKNYSDEKEFLEIFYGFLKFFKVIVTYNGNRFDIEAIKSRSILNKNLELSCFLQFVKKLDLYHFLKISLNNKNISLSLKNVEMEFLGVDRIKDIDSAEIPIIYKQFVQTNYDENIIKNIYYHNLYDVYSLKKLLFFIDREINNEKHFNIYKVIKYFIGKKYFEFCKNLIFFFDKNLNDPQSIYYLIKILKRERKISEIETIFNKINENYLFKYFPLLEEYLKFMEWVKKDFEHIFYLIDSNYKKLVLYFNDEEIDKINKRIKRISNKI